MRDELFQSVVGAMGARSDGFLEGMLLAAGVGLITLVVVRSLMKRQKRARAADDETPREKMERISSQGMARDRIETLMVEAQELTRVCAAQIENKAAVLERLIAIADDRIAKLEELTGNEVGAAEVKPSGAAPRRENAPPTDPLTRKVYEMADAGSPSIDIARELDEQVGKVDLILALRGN